MHQRLLATLLHYANSASHSVARNDFYSLKGRLLDRFATLTGYDIQEIRKECWGRMDHMGDWEGCKGGFCLKCQGTGVFMLRYELLSRWEWCGYVFHRPVRTLTKLPAPQLVNIHGRIQHPDYGKLSREATLWLYLICCEWGLFYRALTTSRYCGFTWLPLCNVQKVAMELRMRFSWHKCFCGRWFPTWGTGWQVCKECRKPRVYDETPF